MVQAAAIQAHEFYLLGQLFQRKDGMSVEQIKLIRATIEAAHQAEVPAKTRFTALEALTILSAAGRALLAKREHMATALIMAQNVPDRLHDRTGVAVLRCRALIALRRRDETVAEANRLLALKPVNQQRDRALIDLLRSELLHHDLDADFRLHDLLWGKAGATMLDTVKTLDPAIYRGAFAVPMLRFLLRIRNQPTSDLSALRNDLAWSLASGFYRKFLTAALVAIRRKGLSRVELAQTAEPIAYLESSGETNKVPANPALQALVASGRSVVLLQCHSGARGVISSSLDDLDTPLSLVGKGARIVRIREGDFNITTGNASSLPIQFLKLAKLARKGPRVIRLMPDGPDGSEFGTVDLFGRKVQVGLGGASLALHGKAVLAFARTRWTGKDWAVEVEVGPDMAEVPDRAAAERLFLDFYAENLRQVLLGPPKDIGGSGGYLLSLRKATK